MADLYLIGVFLALIAGVSNAIGNILQKKVVNEIPIQERDDKFMRSLIKNPTWILGLASSMGLSTIFIMTAQYMIGPVLVPGLTASGMIFLAIGSIKLLNEKLRSSEIVGILMMIVAIILLAFSNLDIPNDDVNLLDINLIIRMVIFTGIMLILFFFFIISSKKFQKKRGLIFAVSGGFLFALTNLWMSPLVVSIGPIFSLSAHALEIIIFILAIVILFLANIYAIKYTQEAYKFAQASNVQPTQQIPTQIAPIFIYFAIFTKTASVISIFLIVIGVLIIIIGGFLLSQRQAELEAIE